MDALGSRIDPQDVEWIWLTHPDRDHTGSLFDLLDAAPRARVITTFVGAGIMSTEHPLPMERVYLLNPGQSLDVGDRRLTAFRPPLFDNPSTTGFYDDHTGACFSSDCFGAPMPSAELATCPDAGYLDADDLRARQLLWATVDSPWVQIVDQAKYLDSFATLRVIDPALILSTHLPPAVGRTPEFLQMLAAAPEADPFVGPDHAELQSRHRCGHGYEATILCLSLAVDLSRWVTRVAAANWQSHPHELAAVWSDGSDGDQCFEPNEVRRVAGEQWPSVGTGDGGDLQVGESAARLAPLGSNPCEDMAVEPCGRSVEGERDKAALDPLQTTKLGRLIISGLGGSDPGRQFGEGDRAQVQRAVRQGIRIESVAEVDNDVRIQQDGGGRFTHRLRRRCRRTYRGHPADVPHRQRAG